MERNSDISSVINFIREYWVELSLAYVHKYREHGWDYLDGRTKHGNAWWSCLFAGPMVRDFFTDLTKDTRVKGIVVASSEDLESFIRKLQPGYNYTMDMSSASHEFNLTYLNDDTIIYSDYYSETGRGRTNMLYDPENEDYLGTDGPNAFRMEVMSKSKLVRYLRDYMQGNREGQREFHLGNERFLDYTTQPEDVGYITFNYEATPITRYPRTPGDVLESCWISLVLSVNSDRKLDMQYCVELLFRDIGRSYNASEEEVLLKVNRYMDNADNLIKAVGAMSLAAEPALINYGSLHSKVDDYFIY